MNPSLQEAVDYGRQLLSDSPSPDVDAKTLLCHVLDCSPGYLFTWPEKQLTTAQWQTFKTALASRSQGMPVAQITGRRGFWTLDLSVNNSTLIPRADTELLVSLALAKLQTGMRVIDLGTGTGAIILSLASERPEIHFFASDFSFDAVSLAQFNAQQHQLDNVSFVQAHWLTAFKSKQFDLIVSNPPYIRNDDPHLIRGDLRFEPRTALASGEDGLDDIRLIVFQALTALKPGGWLLVEHGYDQGKQVVAIFQQAGFEQVELHQDFGGQDRAVLGQLRV